MELKINQKDVYNLVVISISKLKDYLTKLTHDPARVKKSYWEIEVRADEGYMFLRPLMCCTNLKTDLYTSRKYFVAGQNNMKNEQFKSAQKNLYIANTKLPSLQVK